MNAVERWMAAGGRLARRSRWLTLVVILWLGTSSDALAQKKKQEKEAAPTKSYVLPYMIVLAVVGVGVMTVCRPGRRLDKPHERIKDDEE